MKRSEILEKRRKRVSSSVRRNVELSFKIVDRIQAVLDASDLKQRDLAHRLNKSESEISKWMRGTHNFTLETICSIEEALECRLVEVPMTTIV